MVLAHLGDDGAIAVAAREVSDLTRADPRAGDACVLWCGHFGRAGLCLAPPERLRRPGRGAENVL